MWLLGRQYSARYDLTELRQLVTSRPWLTYRLEFVRFFLWADCGNLEKDMCWWKVLRKDFPAIGSSGLTSDQGWGCMLRCGQMVLAGALLDYRLANIWPENRLSISHFTWQVRQRVEVGERPTKWWISGSDGQVEKSCRTFHQNLSVNSRFRDIKSAQYSIHQIALMGESVDRFRT